MSDRLELLTNRLHTASKLVSQQPDLQHIDLLLKALEEILKRLDIEIFVDKHPTPQAKAMLAMMDIRQALDNYLANILGDEYECAELSAKQIKKMADQLLHLARSGKVNHSL